jgi:hypothetical protein
VKKEIKEKTYYVLDPVKGSDKLAEELIDTFFKTERAIDKLGGDVDKFGVGYYSTRVDGVYFSVDIRCIDNSTGKETYYRYGGGKDTNISKSIKRVNLCTHKEMTKNSGRTDVRRIISVKDNKVDIDILKQKFAECQEVVKASKIIADELKKQREEFLDKIHAFYATTKLNRQKISIIPPYIDVNENISSIMIRSLSIEDCLKIMDFMSKSGIK